MYGRHCANPYCKSRDVLPLSFYKDEIVADVSAYYGFTKDLEICPHCVHLLDELMRMHEQALRGESQTVWR